mmetsp:Transcript_5071/g.7664  ORF Transcript_5071/g.7664 Transcript_5071/m.7664 type:complete len:112 (+) Transcript_5071:501-836(+)
MPDQTNLKLNSQPRDDENDSFEELKEELSLSEDGSDKKKKTKISVESCSLNSSSLSSHGESLATYSKDDKPTNKQVTATDKLNSKRLQVQIIGPMSGGYGADGGSTSSAKA